MVLKLLQNKDYKLASYILYDLSITPNYKSFVKLLSMEPKNIIDFLDTYLNKNYQKPIRIETKLPSRDDLEQLNKKELIQLVRKYKLPVKTNENGITVMKNEQQLIKTLENYKKMLQDYQQKRRDDVDDDVGLDVLFDEGKQKNIKNIDKYDANEYLSIVDSIVSASKP